MSNNEIFSGTLTLYICNGINTLDEWDLLRWIVLKTLAGTELYAKAEWAGKHISGRLLPHSIDRTQHSLTRSLLVDVITDDGTYTFHCKCLTHINTHP